MDYNKARGGKWANTDDLKDGQKAKILDECTKQESQFKDKDGNPKVENIAKVQFQGLTEPVNARLNWTTINGLIDAFGKESKEWIGKVLTVKLIDGLVGDTMRTILYLIPEGFELGKTADKKLVIRKIGDVAPDESQYPANEISPDDIPF
jgi:hypothetical protein